MLTSPNKGGMVPKLPAHCLSPALEFVAMDNKKVLQKPIIRFVCHHKNFKPLVRDLYLGRFSRAGISVTVGMFNDHLGAGVRQNRKTERIVGPRVINLGGGHCRQQQ